MSREWKIYTKTGDKGETSLIGGRRVPKHHVQIEAYGTVDELNAHIGLLREMIDFEPHAQEVLLEVMDRLFTSESLLALDQAGGNDQPVSKRPIPTLKEDDILILEQEIDKMNESLPELSTFILPGGSKPAAQAHVARCVCRRAERTVLRLSEEIPVEPLVIKLLNRLSDYLFVLARFLVLKEEGDELPWIPRV